MSKELDVLIAGVHAGAVTQDDDGSLSFSYERGYRGAPLSSAMPLSTRVYRNKSVLPYLWGLLPEDASVRQRVAAEADVSPNNPFALLGVIGRDCPGAVQFFSKGAVAEREGRLVPISDSEIARRLALGREGGGGWIAASEHWSLGGQQNKFALRKQGGLWYSCEGAEATTHIFKSGVSGLSHQALNEYVCMRLAAACGVDAARVEYCEFEGDGGTEPAIVIERYDREVVGSGVVRQHQEDLCQALGCLPDNKYTMYGGPGCREVIGHLLASKECARLNVASFLQMLFFNYLIAATDAHAKNYSILLLPDGSYRLAPMYDVASIAPYVEPREWRIKAPKLAMSIGGENRAGCVTTGNFEKLVEACDLRSIGIDADGCAGLLLHLAGLIPEKLTEIFDEFESMPSAASASDLRAHMEEPIVELCGKSMRMLH